MFTKQQLKSAIYLHYGSLSNLAEDLGIDKSTLSRHLNNPSEKFLSRLKSKGISLTSIKRLNDFISEPSEDYFSDECVKKIEALETKIKELKAELYDLYKKQGDEK